jgi:hypothetical protein
MGPGNIADTSAQFGQAVDNRDTKQLRQIAANNDGTPIADAANHVAEVIHRGNKEYNDTFGPIEKAGGPATQEGRVKIADTWKNNSQNPKYGDALIEFVLGNKEGARKLITGGTISTKITYDNAGSQLLEKVDEAGDRHSVIDLVTGKPVSPEEYGIRKGGQDKLIDTLGYLADKKNLETNIAATNLTIDKANKASAAAPAQLQMNQEFGALLSDLKNSDLPPDVLAKVAQFSTSSIGTSQARSQALTKLGQLIRSGSVKEGDQVEGGLSAGLGIDGAAHFNGKGGITLSNGKSKSLNDLAQDQNSTNLNSQIERNYSQKQEDLAKYLKTGALADKPELQLKLNRALEVAKMIAQKQTEVPDHPFNVPTVGFGVTDEYARGRIQAEQGLLNAKANAAFGQWAAQQLKNYPKDSAPKPAELEAAFVKTPLYQSLIAEYSTKADAILKEPRTFAKNVSVANTGIGMPSGEAAVPPTPAANAPKKTTGNKPSLSDLASQFRK